MIAKRVADSHNSASPPRQTCAARRSLICFDLAVVKSIEVQGGKRVVSFTSMTWRLFRAPELRHWQRFLNPPVANGMLRERYVREAEAFAGADVFSFVRNKRSQKFLGNLAV